MDLEERRKWWEGGKGEGRVEDVWIHFLSFFSLQSECERARLSAVPSPSSHSPNTVSGSEERARVATQTAGLGCDLRWKVGIYVPFTANDPLNAWMRLCTVSSLVITVVTFSIKMSVLPSCVEPSQHIWYQRQHFSVCPTLFVHVPDYKGNVVEER